MKGCSAGLHPPVSALVKTIRSRSSTARKQAFMCGVKSPPFSLIWVTNEPPGLSSILRTLHLAGAGTHHCSKLARSVHALHTAARGALMRREMVRSRVGSKDLVISIFPFVERLRNARAGR